MTAQHRSEGAAGALERPGVDIEEIVGDMPASACECLFADCRLHHRGCDREAKWAARVHAWICPTDANHYRVFNLCDECKKRIEAQSLLSVGSGSSCICGMTGMSVSDFIGPVVHL
ncbi:Uncharacterised protein [Mycobacteroides abscessus subsp. abscessus]|nr:hypothetical protein PROPHIGD05-3_31 [Mycobacterium phage prophiGD05-3]SHU92751.1 Uncharacterised protein [Mycobacteroides abscessus subsp. abscessus]SII21230.1 Uncharacterised protein [Mycobacteroides abscessus subsp. abscessus]SII68386.1 Uncharacterised protein [Mycobacteroides abscessus subsp. abscessus]SIJ96540.1 Uncharacterised protein [Mycobacteroides abscessus subsp. abscessus]